MTIDIIDFVEENVPCRRCGTFYVQRGPAGYGQCDDCFMSLILGEIKDAKDWANDLLNKE